MILQMTINAKSRLCFQSPFFPSSTWEQENKGEYQLLWSDPCTCQAMPLLPRQGGIEAGHTLTLPERAVTPPEARAAKLLPRDHPQHCN